MTRSTRIAALALAAAAACQNGSPTVGGRYAGPVDIVPFRGVTNKGAGVRPYLAVASNRGDELRFLDPSDLQPVLGPGVVFPLSIPTAPHPLLVASASLNDGNDKADVLVAVSAGGDGFISSQRVDLALDRPQLQVIETWTSDSRVAFNVSLATALGADAADAQIVSLAGMPARDTTPARIFAGVSVGSDPTKGKLVVVEFQRAADGVAIGNAPNVVVQPLQFVPLDMAVEPTSSAGAVGTKLYLATRDLIPPTAGGPSVNGVGVIDTAAGAAGSWSVTALDALAPTIAVAAGYVAPRIIDTADGCSPERFKPSQLRVYAVLDPDGCLAWNSPFSDRSDKVINCGVATLDPVTPNPDPTAGNLAPDPAADVAAAAAGDEALPQKYLAPMPVPGVPVRIAIATATAKQADANVPNKTCPTLPDVPTLKIAPGSGQRYTNAIAMVTSTTGGVYWLDLSRWGPPSEGSTLNRARSDTSTPQNAGSGTNVAVTTISSVAVGGDAYLVGLWDDRPQHPTVVTVDPATLLDLVTVWPGFTGDDSWTLLWQGPLPGLNSRAGIVVANGGNAYAAIQTDTGQRDATDRVVWSRGASISDPSLGVRVGDVAVILDSSGTTCETTVASLIPAPVTTTPPPVDPQVGIPIPGGAVQLAGCVPASAKPETPAAATITVRASGFVLANAKQGYMGRPEIGRTVEPTENRFRAVWKGETGLPVGSEALALARKYRRQFYPSDPPCGEKGCYPGFLDLIEPLAPGPVVAFRVGLVPLGSTPADSSATPTPQRDAGLTFTTRSGLTPTARKPTSAGAMPTAVISYDRNARIPASFTTDPIRFFATYLDDVILFFGADGSATDVTMLQ